MLWSWILTLLSVTGLYVAGRNRWEGWLLGLLAQPVWLVYALVTHQYGFLVSVAAFGYVNATNLLSWRRAAVSTGVEREADAGSLALIKIITANHAMTAEQKLDRIDAVLRRAT